MKFGNDCQSYLALAAGHFLRFQAIHRRKRTGNRVIEENAQVRMIADGRTFNVQTDWSQFGKLNESDRVRVSYRIRKYSKTVWAGKIEQIRKE
jgi:hypothetical protein